MNEGGEINGGPAFPGTWWDTNLNGIAPRENYAGMSLRDYFAAKAMVAWLPQDLLSEGAKRDHTTRAIQLKRIASNAYAVADAMLAAK